jgi:hypothetical protein
MFLEPDSVLFWGAAYCQRPAKTNPFTHDKQSGCHVGPGPVIPAPHSPKNRDFKRGGQVSRPAACPTNIHFRLKNRPFFAALLPRGETGSFGAVTLTTNSQPAEWKYELLQIY